MIKCTILQNGNLKITAGNDTRQWIKESMLFTTCKKSGAKEWTSRNYWQIMAELFEDYSTNSKFQHFNPDNANPFVGLTSAPCIAESMELSDDGEYSIVGSLWHFPQYALRYDLEELKNKGFVIYQLVE